MVFRITFLGTGGGRHTTMYQARCTGGMIAEHTGGRKLHIDPGAGALTQMRAIRYDPADTDSVLISHAHPDHYSDAAIVIEGMTKGGWTKRGSVYGSPTVLDGVGDLGPCLSAYHMKIAAKYVTFRPGDVLNIDGLKTEVCKADHTDPANAGFKFSTDEGIVSYVSDTQYSDAIADQYVGTRVLILPVTAPDNIRVPGHINTADAIRFIKRVKPELTVFTHLGIIMIQRHPPEQAAMAAEATGCDVIAADDLTVISLENNRITISKAKTFTGEWYPQSSPIYR